MHDKEGHIISGDIFRNKKSKELVQLLNTKVVNESSEAGKNNLMALYTNKDIRSHAVMPINEFYENFEMTDLNELDYYWGDENDL